MKTIYLLLFLPALFLAQVNTYNQLDINNIKATILPNADFIGSPIGSGMSYQFPKNANIPSITKASLWIGGYTAGNLRTAVMTYRQNGMDFWPGPLDTVNCTIDSTTSINWDKNWKINILEIDSFVTNFNNGNVANGTYIIPPNIASWPGNGNTLANQAAQLAPFYDINADGIYNPYQGDYPKIKGDQAVWSIFNDVLAQHRESGSLGKLGIEIHSMAYAYYCSTLHDSDQAINNTTFYEFIIFNRSVNTIDSTNIGIWIDSDLGFWNDDYVGCDVSNNYAYIYNGDNFDEAAFGAQGYGNNHAFQAFQILRGPGADVNDGKDNDNDGCIDCTFPNVHGCNGIIGSASEAVLPENFLLSGFTPLLSNTDAFNGDPNSAFNGSQFYNLINRKWKNGSEIHYDGLVGKSTTGPVTSFVYPGSSDPFGYCVGGTVTAPQSMNSWTETSAGITPGKRKLLLSIGRFTFFPQTSKTLEFAIVSSRLNNNSGNNFDFTNMQRDTKKIREWYACNSFPSCIGSNLTITVHQDSTSTELLYPNPARNQITVMLGDSIGILRQIKIKNAVGLEVFSIDTYDSEITIPVDTFNSGMYILTVSENGITVATHRFVKI